MTPPRRTALTTFESASGKEYQPRLMRVRARARRARRMARCLNPLRRSAAVVTTPPGRSPAGTQSIILIPLLSWREPRFVGLRRICGQLFTPPVACGQLRCPASGAPARIPPVGCSTRGGAPPSGPSDRSLRRRRRRLPAASTLPACHSRHACCFHHAPSAMWRRAASSREPAAGRRWAPHCVRGGCVRGRPAECGRAECMSRWSGSDVDSAPALLRTPCWSGFGGILYS